MGSKPTPAMLASVSLIVVVILGGLSWFLEPEDGAHWAFRIFMLPALWAFLEFAQYRGEDRGAAGAAIMKWHRLMIAGVGLLITADLGLQLAISTDLLGADWARTGQSVQGIFLGVGLTICGNLLPTLGSPWSLEEQPFAWQRVHRFVGWVATLSGIALVCVWLILPVQEARDATARILAACFVLALGRKLVSVAASFRVTSAAS